MPATYEPIATTTLGSAASTITFNSIGAGYTDLRLIVVLKTTTDPKDLWLRFNNISTTTYSRTNLWGNGTTTGSTRATDATAINITSRSYPNQNYFAFSAIDIFSYAGSTNKTVLAETSGEKNANTYPDLSGVDRTVGLWRSTSAITRIDLSLEGGADTFASGTTATLYGITKF